MKETLGEVRIWNSNGNATPDGYNIVEFDTLALKSDIEDAAETQSTLLEKLGIVTAADDTAAAAADVAVGSLYFTGTKYVLRQS